MRWLSSAVSVMLYGENFKFENVGRRKDVFDGAATCVYVRRTLRIQLKEQGEVQICVSKSPCCETFEPGYN